MDLIPSRKQNQLEEKDVANIRDSVGSSNEEVPLALKYAPSPTPSSDNQQEEQPQEEMSPMTPSRPEVFAPSPNIGAGSSFENIEEIAEAIIKEKWDELTQNIGDLRLWKERIDTDLSGVKQELIRTQNRFENLQKAMLGKIDDYDTTMKDVSAEMKALSKVLEKIISPLTKNVKDLALITDKMRRK